MLKGAPARLITVKDVFEVTKLGGKNKGKQIGRQMHLLRNFYWAYFTGVSHGVQNKAAVVFEQHQVGRNCPVVMQVYLNAWQQVFCSIRFRTDLAFDEKFQQLAILYFLFDHDNLSELARKMLIRQQRLSEMLYGRSRNAQWKFGRPGIYDYLIAAERYISDVHDVNALVGIHEKEFEPQMNTDRH